MRSMISLFVALALAAPLGARAAGGAADAMAEAMARMMQAMGMLDVTPGSSMSPMAYMMPGMGSFGSGEMPWAQMPWGQVPGYGAFTDPIKAFGMPGAWQQMPMGMSWPWGGAGGNALDGIWEGRDGGLFIVRGQRFRLHAAQGGHIEGLVQRSGDRMALYEPSSESVKAYEIAMQQGRMILRDERGQTYLYRRLWLDEPAYGTSASD